MQLRIRINHVIIKKKQIQTQKLRSHAITIKNKI